MAYAADVTALLIRGGTVVDGSGGPPRPADVRLAGGRVVEVGARLRPDGEAEIDAGGALVTPGFIDVHTHFDPSMFWDPWCDPMPQHGITSVVFGNCSLSLAPLRADRRAELTSLFCYIEDLPEASFDHAIPWTWERYGEYAAVLDGMHLGVNVAGFVGHTLLRLFVMGDAAWERPSTPVERNLIAAALDECLAAGALGMSTSQGFDEDRARRPVPSRVADDAELAALAAVLAQHGRVLQFIADPTDKAGCVRRMSGICAEQGTTCTWIAVFHDARNPEVARGYLDLCADLSARGVRCHPQVSPRSLDMQVNWQGGMSFVAMTNGWHRAVQADATTKATLLVDPAWRDVARAEWDSAEHTNFGHRSPENVRILRVTRPEHERWVGRSFADVIAERGGHPSDVLADLLLENALDLGVIAVGVWNGDPAGVGELLQHSAAILGNSDAGAHQQMFSAAGDSTLLLARHVRERGDLTIEAAVHKLTAEPARIFGLGDRGTLVPGAAADVTVFALDELHWDPDVFVADQPLGAARLRRPEGGYWATITGGVVTQQGGTLTGATPGRYLHGRISAP